MVIIMKELKREVQRTETIVTYEAMDGEVFKDRQECVEYEESIKNTIKGKWAELKKTKGGDACYYIEGCNCDDTLYLVHLASENDVNVLNAFMDNIYGGNNPHRADYADIGNDVLVVVGYDNDWIGYYGTIEKHLQSLTNSFNKLTEALHPTETESEVK